MFCWFWQLDLKIWLRNGLRNEGWPLSHGACEGAAAAAGFSAGGIQTEFSVQSFEFGGMGLKAYDTFCQEPIWICEAKDFWDRCEGGASQRKAYGVSFYMRQQRLNILTVARHLFEQASPPRVCTSSCTVAFLLDASQCGRLPSMCGTCLLDDLWREICSWKDVKSEDVWRKMKTLKGFERVAICSKLLAWSKGITRRQWFLALADTSYEGRCKTQQTQHITTHSRHL